MSSPNNPVTEDEGIAFEIELACLAGHPREDEILDAIPGHAGEILSLLDGDLVLLSRVYAAFGIGLFMEQNDGEDSDAPPEIAAAGLVSFHGDTMDAPHGSEVGSRAPVAPYRPTANKIKNDFRYKSPLGQSLHILEYGSDARNSGAIDPDKLPEEIDRNAGLLHDIEAAFEDHVAKAGRVLHAFEREWLQTAPLDERKNPDDHMFLDTHLYSTWAWQGLATSWIRECIRNLNPAKSRSLETAVDRLPASLRSIVYGDLIGVTDRIDTLRTEMISGLSKGVTEAEVRNIFSELKLDRYDVAVRTWLNALEAKERVRREKRNGRLTYFSVDGNWPN